MQRNIGQRNRLFFAGEHRKCIHEADALIRLDPEQALLLILDILLPQLLHLFITETAEPFVQDLPVLHQADE
ncbi:hypothetical protein D3C75_983070 [compost metagenome]